MANCTHFPWTTAEFCTRRKYLAKYARAREIQRFKASCFIGSCFSMKQSYLFIFACGNSTSIRQFWTPEFVSTRTRYRDMKCLDYIDYVSRPTTALCLQCGRFASLILLTCLLLYRVRCFGQYASQMPRPKRSYSGLALQTQYRSTILASHYPFNSSGIYMSFSLQLFPWSDHMAITLGSSLLNTFFMRLYEVPSSFAHLEPPRKTSFRSLLIQGKNGNSIV